MTPARLQRKNEENSSVNNKVSHIGELVMNAIEAWVQTHAPPLFNHIIMSINGCFCNFNIHDNWSKCCGIRCLL